MLQVHYGLLPVPRCYGFATGKLWGNWCNGFGLLVDEISYHAAGRERKYKIMDCAAKIN